MGKIEINLIFIFSCAYPLTSYWHTWNSVILIFNTIGLDWTRKYFKNSKKIKKGLPNKYMYYPLDKNLSTVLFILYTVARWNTA